MCDSLLHTLFPQRITSENFDKRHCSRTIQISTMRLLDKWKNLTYKSNIFISTIHLQWSKCDYV